VITLVFEGVPTLMRVSVGGDHVAWPS
jgi:hypothetical protein